MNPTHTDQFYTLIKSALHDADLLARRGDIAAADQLVRSCAKHGATRADILANTTPTARRKLRAYAKKMEPTR